MNIYVGNLNYRIKEHDLQHALKDYGTVDSVRIIRDRETGKSKGYGFVEMPNEEEATKMINELNGTEFEGRQIVIKEALPKKV